MTIDELNRLSKGEAIEQFILCCGSSAWAGKMARRRPYSSKDEVIKQAGEIWNHELASSDWLEAFSAHPKIGGLGSLRKKYASTKKWAEGEQKGIANAPEEVLERLAAGNQEYENKFGYIFIVCATGKSAGEMLQILESRLDNQPGKELAIAAEEQRKITEIRLEKLLD